MRKILALLIVTILAVSNFGVSSVSASGFSDVPSNHGFYKDVMFLLDKGVISSSKAFGINQKVTREEVAVMVSKAVGLDGTKTSTPFKDVPSTLSSSGYINSAVNAGIIQGYKDGTFKPKTIVNRGQMAIFLARAFKLNEESPMTFKDMSPNMASYSSVKKIVASQITTGFTDHTFKPNETLTRGQISAFIARAMRDSTQEFIDQFSDLNIENVRYGINDVYSDAVVTYNAETRSYEIQSFNKKYDKGFYLYMYGKYSNVGNYFVQLDILNSLVPEYANEFKEDLKQMEVHKYNQKLYVNLVNIIQFYRTKNLQVEYRTYDDGYVTFDIKEIESLVSKH